MKSPRTYWFTYFIALLLLAPLLGYLVSSLPKSLDELQYIMLAFILCYIALGIVTVYAYCKISDLEIGWATVATIVFAIPGIGLIMLANATIWSEDIAPNLFWKVTESMLAIGLSNALGMCIAPAFKKNRGD